MTEKTGFFISHFFEVVFFLLNSALLHSPSLAHSLSRLELHVVVIFLIRLLCIHYQLCYWCVACLSCTKFRHLHSFPLHTTPQFANSDCSLYSLSLWLPFTHAHNHENNFQIISTIFPVAKIFFFTFSTTILLWSVRWYEHVRALSHCTMVLEFLCVCCLRAIWNCNDFEEK